MVFSTTALLLPFHLTISSWARVWNLVMTSACEREYMGLRPDYLRELLEGRFVCLRARGRQASPRNKCDG